MRGTACPTAIARALSCWFDAVCQKTGCLCLAVVQEPACLDDRHMQETIDWMVVDGSDPLKATDNALPWTTGKTKNTR